MMMWLGVQLTVEVRLAISFRRVRAGLASGRLGLAPFGGEPACGAMDPPNAGTQTSVLYPEEADQDELPPLDMPPATVRPLTSADLPPASVFSARPSPRNARLTIERRGGGHRGPYWSIIEREAAPYGVPSEVVDAVMARESGYNP